MYKLPTSNYLQRSLLINQRRARLGKFISMSEHRKRVAQELKNSGLSRYAMSSMEAKHLHKIIHHDEYLGGAVFGHHKDGFVILVATNKRVVFLDKKPLFINKDDMTYDVVSGVSFSRAGFGSTLVLHTRIKDISIRTFNQKSAEQFMSFIDTRCIERDYGSQRAAISYY